MPANYELLDAFGQLMREKSVDKAVLIETLEAGLLSAARRKYGSSCDIQVKFDEDSGAIKMGLVKTVVDRVEDSQSEIDLEAAKRVDQKAEIGSTVSIPLSVEQFGRNAIQAAKQVLIQRVREAERDKVYEIYHDKIGALVTGTVQQVDRGNVILKLDRSEAVLPGKEVMRRDRYRQGDHARAVVVSVDKSAKGPQVTLSRTRPEFVQRLFESEVPEIAEGIVEIKAIAREAGARSKVSVSSNDDKVDAVGACVGIKGTRVQSIVRELGGERIDVISWSADPTIMVSRSLSPAKIGRVISDEASEKLTVVVADDQLSLAIGKGGQNARLAAKLIGWKIDLVSQVEFDQRELIDAATRIEVEMMEGVGPKLAAKLIKAGLETVEDVHKASVEDLMEVPGVGAKTAEKLKKIADVAYHVARQAAEEARQEAEREAEEARKAEELSKAEEESKGKEKGQAEEALKGESEATEPEGEEPAGKEVSDAESAASEEGGEEKPPPDVGQDRPSESELDAVQEEPGFDSEGDSGAEEKTSPAAAGPDPEEEAK